MSTEFDMTQLESVSPVPPRLICCHFPPQLRCTHVRSFSFLDVGRWMKYMQRRQRRIDLQELFSSFPPHILAEDQVSRERLNTLLYKIMP